MSTSAKSFPIWAFLSLLTNGVLVLAIILLFLRQHGMTDLFRKAPTSNQINIEAPQLGERHQLNYKQWVDILAREAKVVAEQRPQHLTILLGDSLSLWFPSELLPEERTWLNQGISGETSTGLLKRLNLFDRTQPETIFIMIGINDLIRGVESSKILDNHRQIIAYLKRKHPKSQIVVQSILPHGGEEATWEGKEKLLAIPNNWIRELNQQLQTIAIQEGIKYLDLHPLFVNKQGNIRLDLSTDGLHLSKDGYLVWRSALQLYSGLELNSIPAMRSLPTSGEG
ncbi:MAG: G-D-S-L family lipolytic protein [Calothrix sp. C42_A2020_038]|nr:G-D-S-L family lipolytic protein [Calothrix sp. C42_A2020_038]